MGRLLIILPLLILAATALADDFYGPYRATVLRVIDGDTVEVAVAVWPGDSRTVLLRLAGVDAPERHAKAACEREAGEHAADFSLRFVARSKIIIVRDIRLGKYAGRVIGRLIVGRRDLGNALLKAGLARPYDGGKRKPWC